MTRDKPADKLLDNILHFARALRRAGLRVGPGQVIDAVEAVKVAGLRSRRDFYWLLHCLFVKTRADSALFDQAFHVFWRRRALIEEMMSMMLPDAGRPAASGRSKAGARRVAEAMLGQTGLPRPKGESAIEINAALTWSGDDVLRSRDFEQMSGEEQARARAAMARMAMPVPERATRRFRASARGRAIDMRATLRASLRAGGEAVLLKRKAPARRRPPLVVLCDISGSMEGYSRMFLHFLHCLAHRHDRVHSFVFGTRVTNISRRLKLRDVDQALSDIGEDVEDWSGGTRIGACLETFNKTWSRRVLSGGARVLLITDGLDRGDLDMLDAQTARLARSCSRLIWLNPLLRYDGFEARAGGIRTMLKSVDEFRPVHNLESIASLVEAINGWSADAARPEHWLRAA